VITKEGSLDRYTVSDGKIRTPDRKHFGPSPFSIEGPFGILMPARMRSRGSRMIWLPPRNPFTLSLNEVPGIFADTDPNNDATPQELLEI
jgi:hypothetical protein